MNNNPVGWFEIPVNDVARATKFYEALLNVRLKRENMSGYEMIWFPMMDDAKGISGCLMKGEGYHPGPGGVVIYFTCPDIDVALERVKDVGGKVLLSKKDIGKWGTIAWLTDSEGNTIALHHSSLIL